jgi:hypothetical protein
MRRTILLCLCGLLTSAALPAQTPASSPPGEAKGVRGLCGCILKEAVKRWGPGAVTHPQEEVAALTQELVKSGVCHLPDFAVPAPPKK